jgi:putative transposase
MKQLSDLTITDLWKEVKSEDQWWGDLRGRVSLMVRSSVEGAIEEEFKRYIKVKPYERSPKRRDQRNGSYSRSLETEFGILHDILIPRSRKGGFHTGVFGRYQRRQMRVDEAIKDIFLSGASTRRVREVLEPLIGCRPSASTVSKVCKDLDRQVRAYHRRKLGDGYRYLFLDGITLKVKKARGAKKRLVLCAYGIRHDGRRELISFRLADSESGLAWEVFLNDLYKRGLTGDNLELITTDGAPGLLEALDMVYPYVPRQRCWVHKLRNVSSKLRKRDQEACLAGAKEIYKARNRREALKRFREWAQKWRGDYEKAVACIEDNLDELLAFFDFPKDHWRKIRTTNVIERFFEEIRRRVRSMRCFTNDASCERIIFAIASRQNRVWERYPLKLSGMRPVGQK